VINGQRKFCFNNANGDAFILTASNILGTQPEKRAKCLVIYTVYTRFVMSNLFRNCLRRV